MIIFYFHLLILNALANWLMLLLFIFYSFKPCDLENKLFLFQDWSQMATAH